MLLREGWRVNHKRKTRLYREESLKLRPKKRKRVAALQRVRPKPTTAINELWTMDFVHDTLSCGRRFRALNIIDARSRECLAVEVDTGSEFTGRKLDEWAYNKIKLHFIEPGKPT